MDETGLASFPMTGFGFCANKTFVYTATELLKRLVSQLVYCACSRSMFVTPYSLIDAYHRF
jgi:hypothetical protein